MVLATELPTRKRVRLEYPWFSLGYWKTAGKAGYADACRSEYAQTNNSLLPLWTVNPSAAGRGRSGDTLCLSDYNLSVSVPGSGFCAGPLVFRGLERSGGRVRLNGFQSSGAVVLDLAGENQSLELSGSLNARVLLSSLENALSVRVLAGAAGRVELALANASNCLQDKFAATWNSTGVCKLDFYAVVPTGAGPRRFHFV